MDCARGRPDWLKVVGVVIVGFLVIENIILIQQNRELQTALHPAPREILVEGESVGPFKVRSLNGDSITINYADSTKKYLLFVFTVTCPHCHKNLGRWNALVKNIGEVRDEIVGICVSDLEHTLKYRDTTGIIFRLAALADTSFLRRYKITLFPETILVNGNGRVKKVWAGELSESQISDILMLMHSSTKTIN